MPGAFRLKYPFSSVATQRLLLLKKNILARKSPPWHFNIFYWMDSKLHQQLLKLIIKYEMKKILLLVSSFLCILSSTAELKVDMQSWNDFAAGNVEAGVGSMGRTDMTDANIEWGTDTNGEDARETSSCLFIYFKNMAPEDLKDVNVQIDDQHMYSRLETTEVHGLPTLKIIFESGKNLGINLQHRNTNIGYARIEPRDYLPGHVYGLEILNAGLVSMAVISEPAGAAITLDGEDTGKRTPFTFEKIPMGKHTISLTPGDPKIAEPISDKIIYVTSAARAFNFPMYKTKNVRIVPTPGNAEVTVSLNGQVVARGLGEIKLDSARYGIPYQLKGVAGTDEMVTPFIVNDLTPSVYKFKIIGAKQLSFFAKQNNKSIEGAEIVINGAPAGYTPYSTVLDYGEYSVSASYDGYTKLKKVKVNKNTKDILIKIPNHKTVGYNPFDIDYRKREWGLAVNYIHRFFNFKKNGKTTKYNWVGQEGGSNGVQVGITYQPYFGYGQGLATGLYWQGTFGTTDFNTGYGTEEVSYNESALYFPLQYQFRLPLHQNFSIAVNAGAALTLGLSNKFSNSLASTDGSYDIGYGYNSEFGTYSPDKFDYSILIGASIQYKALQIEGKYSIGLKNHSVVDSFEDSGSLSYKSSFLSAGISLMF